MSRNSKGILDHYRNHWPRIGALAAMALGGASVLTGGKKHTSLRGLAVMNSMTMSAHQFEEYVEPGWFPGMANKGMFGSEDPRRWPMNRNGTTWANLAFSLFHLAPVLFPDKKWVAMPPAILSIGQAFAHGVVTPIRTRKLYNPGAATGVLLFLPIGITYLQKLREAQGRFTGGDWAKAAGVLAAFFVIGVGATNGLTADKNSPYPFSEHQMGPYREDRRQEEEGDPADTAD